MGRKILRQREQIIKKVDEQNMKILKIDARGKLDN